MPVKEGESYYNAVFAGYNTKANISFLLSMTVFIASNFFFLYYGQIACFLHCFSGWGTSF